MEKKLYNLGASTGPGVFVVLCAFLCSGAPEDSTGSSSGLNRPRDDATA